MNLNDRGKNELVAGIVGVVTGLSFLLFSNFWKGIIEVGSYIDSAQTLPWVFRVIAYCYIVLFGVLALSALPKILISDGKTTSKKVMSSKSPFLTLLVAAGLVYIVVLLVLGISVGSGPAGLALFPLIMGFWILGPILPLAFLLLNIKKTTLPLRRYLQVFVGLSVTAVVAAGIYAAVKQQQHDQPLPRTEVLNLISTCQLREVYRDNNNQVELLFKGKSNLPADKLMGNSKDYKVYVDAILKARPTCVVAYRDDSNAAYAAEISSMEWSSIEQAQTALRSCSINRIVVSSEVMAWTTDGQPFPGQNTGILFKSTGYKGRTLEIQESIIDSNIKAMRASLDEACGKNAIYWMRNNNQPY